MNSYNSNVNAITPCCFVVCCVAVGGNIYGPYSAHMTCPYSLRLDHFRRLEDDDVVVTGCHRCRWAAGQTKPFAAEATQARDFVASANAAQDGLTDGRHEALALLRWRLQRLGLQLLEHTCKPCRTPFLELHLDFGELAQQGLRARQAVPWRAAT